MDKLDDKVEMAVKIFFLLFVACLMVLVLIAFVDMVYHGVVDGWATLV